ncbi:hypothetical protein ANCCAN_04755 [Ancylostoma caninum]|uniref:Uncharacterized protein n=1 Tax=Ancylostoma caninum TaxID=29170 RepID=A0A368GXU3_ANCCA|nr:hypothetical protein ANCCAN_04755 [Ancylostoma caninum]
MFYEILNQLILISSTLICSQLRRRSVGSGRSDCSLGFCCLLSASLRTSLSSKRSR